MKKLTLFVLVLFSFSACEKDASSPIPTDTLFQSLSASSTNITFKNQLTETEKFNIIQYLYYYNGGGVAIGDVNKDGLEDLYFSGNQVPNKLYLNKGNFEFEDVTDAANVAGNHGENSWTTGVSMVDINADGWLDIYVCEVGKYKHIRGKNKLYINQKVAGNTPIFKEEANVYQLDFQGFSQQMAWLDYDADGDLDGYLLNHSVHSAENYSKSEIRNKKDRLAGDLLLRNDGGKFTDVTMEAGIYSSKIGFGLGVVVGDVNGDFRPDIYVTNDFHENDYLYYNNGDGTFSEGLTESIGHTSTFSMGCDIGDINGDQKMDIMSLDMKPSDEIILKSSVGADAYNIYQYKLNYGYHYQYPRNALQLNRGHLKDEKTVQFSEIGQLAGVAATDWSWSTLMADFDLDGAQDIYITNGIWRRPNDLDYLQYISNEELQETASDLALAAQMPSGKVVNFAFKNTQNTSKKEGKNWFKNVSKEWGLDLTGCSNGTAYADLDNDGDLDLIVNNLNAPASIYRNQTIEKKKANYLKVKLLPEDPGATIEVNTKSSRLRQTAGSVRGWQSSVSKETVFGLDTMTSISSVYVHWSDGMTQEVNTPINTTVEVRKNAKDYVAVWPVAKEPIFRNVTDSILGTIQHKENRFVDFNIEKLLPQKRSTKGPKIAVADVNKDGLDDFYLCAAKGQTGQLFQQQKDGTFKDISPAIFQNDLLKEDTDAVFFDADQDGDVDLLIGSGGGEYSGENEQLLDRLYLNTNGAFIPAPADVLPNIYTNTGCVEILDFNGDNAPDIFIGGHSEARQYGIIPRSFLLQNDGKGHFTDVTATITPNIAQAGMITDALWLPKTKELALVGEWMPVHIFRFKDGLVNERKIAGNGWWNTIYAADINGDNTTELLLGNMGLNTNLHATKDKPMRLYATDLDDNYSIDPILTYYKNGQEYPQATKDEITKQLTYLRKRFTDNKSYANSNIEGVFEEKLNDIKPLIINELASLVCDLTGSSVALPNVAQYAPIQSFLVHDFDKNGQQDILAVGNFYGYSPTIGRADASYGTLLMNNGADNLQSINLEDTGFAIVGDARDVKLLRTIAGKSLVLVAVNDGDLQAFLVE